MSQQMQNNSDNEQKSDKITGTLSIQPDQASYAQALPMLAIHLRGELLLPGDPDFESLRKDVWNGTHEGFPAIIVRCVDADDVIAAVNFAREQSMEVSVRSGGHSVAGYGTNNGGMVIDLSGMKAITIYPEQRIAHIEPGLTWGEVANTLQPYGLALTSGDTASVGVGGLLLGGGIGWMARKYGLTIDHLRAVELVTAYGQLLRASARENADLFWGLRGGGGNLGIATAFEVNLDPAEMILGGAVFYDVTDSERILQAYASYAEAAPDELTTMAMLMAAPPAPFIPPDKQGKPVLAIALCYTGDLAEGERIVAPLRSLGTPMAEVVAPMPYPAIFTFTEEATIRGLPQYVRSLFARTLTDAMIHTIAEAAVDVISHETMVQIRILGGAISRVPTDATAFAHRDKHAWVSVFNTEWQPDNGKHLANAEQVWQSLRPYADGVYVNFLADEGEERVHEAYPPAAYARLVALKNRYDPTNMFHLNQNSKPTL